LGKPAIMVCELCGKESCSGKLFMVHVKYNHYIDVDKYITVCESQVYMPTGRPGTNYYYRSCIDHGIYREWLAIPKMGDEICQK